MKKYYNMIMEITKHPQFISCSIENKPLPGAFVQYEHTLTISVYGDGIIHSMELKSNHLSSLVDRALNLFNIITMDPVI